MKRSLGLLIVAVMGCGVLAAVVQGDEPAAPQISSNGTGDPHLVAGFGKPSEEHRVSFPTDFSGTPVIKQVMVKDGQSVKAGDPLMVEDMVLAQKQLDILKAAAAITAPIEEAQVQIDIKQQELDNFKGMSEADATSSEKLNIQLDHDVAVARKKEAEQELHEKAVEVAHEEALIQEMTLRSPVAGIVRKISLFEGEVVQPKDDGACYIVVTDPLWVEVDTLPAAVIGKLKVGDVVKIAYPDSPTEWHDATVSYLDPVVQESTQWRTVRFSMPNPENHPAGLQMLVKLPDRILADSSMAGAK